MDTPAAPLLSEHNGDTMHCEEQLKTTLLCDDKEELRRRLALLQREYLRTAERLQRAERLDAVKRHVRRRIRISQQDQGDGEATENPCIDPSSLILNGTAPSVAVCQGQTAGPADSGTSRRRQVIRFLLPSDDACPQTPDPSHDAATDPRPSPALRLRSRRSRLRWERRSAEAGSQEGREQSQRTEAVGAEERVETEVVNESEELFSGTDSESPSLLLSHWNSCGKTETGDINGQKIQEHEGKEKDTELTEDGKSTSLLLSCGNTEEREQDDTKNGRGRETKGGENNEQRDGRLYDDSSEDSAAEKTRSETSQNKAEIEEEISEKVEEKQDVKAVSLLDSCTLVEGLLFPVEYYVRTTRRMTLSQSQPDMQAILLSQLSAGRRRRSRGRGSNSQTNSHECSDQQTGSSSPVGPCVGSAELNSPSSSQTSDQISNHQINTESCFSHTDAHPARAGRKRKSRGKGRPQTPRCSLSLDTHQPPSLCLHGDDGPEPRHTPGEAVPVQDDLQPAAPSSSAVSGAQSVSACGHPEKVFPIFLRSSNKTNGSTQTTTSAASWQAFLLPSFPPAPTSLLPLPSPSLGASLLNKIYIPQDFHLPDDQFASLKLLKLRQVAAGSGAERFTAPTFNTRTRSQSCVAGDPVLPLSLTPTVSNSPTEQAASQSAERLVDKLTSSAEASPQRDFTEISAEQKTIATESVSVPQECVDLYLESNVVIVSTCGVSAGAVAQQPHSTNSPAGTVSDLELHIKDSPDISLGEQTDSHGVVRPLADQSSTSHQRDDRAAMETLSFDCPLQKTPEETPNSCSAAQLCNVSGAPGESPVQHLRVKSPDADSKEPTTSPSRQGLVENPTRMDHRSQSQLLVSPHLAPALCPFITPHLPGSALLSSPALPSLGLSPHPVPSSPPVPSLTLPPPPSPSTQALSPPALSPCPSLPHSQPTPDVAGEILASFEQLCTEDHSQRAEHPECLTPSSTQGETAEKQPMRRTHTLKAPAGGRLVDACCLLSNPQSSDGLWVAAAGVWAVCLWSQTSASDWSLRHTWAFNEPVISVFPIPDAAGLMCVTLGQLEIREVRILSCFSLSQVLLCDTVVQAVVGVSKSRVVTSSPSACGSILQVFTLSDSGSTSSSLPLVFPGVCVGDLAPVDGLSDALIGSDEGRNLFIWNLKTGQLLRTVVLGDDLSHMAVLRGYSCCGVLFALLQHRFLGSLEEEAHKEEEERETAALFSLVAVNPLSGNSVLATRLFAPKAWTGRLCEADVDGSSVVGLSQSGCVCVWELGPRGPLRMVWAPEGEGWQLARWAHGGTLVMGHHNGDVTLHFSL